MTEIGKTARAYRAIEDMILFGEIAPGSLVSEAMLMDQIGLGRTPIREALQQLSRNRMVEIHPNKGVLVPPISVEAQFRLLETRRVLEALAVQLACRRATEADRRSMVEMKALLTEGSFAMRAYIETVQGTHDLIVKGARNDYLAAAMGPLQGLSRRFWISHVVDERKEIDAGRRLHMAILHAIIDQDTAAAEKFSIKLNDYLVDFARDTVGR
jgi:DNA-binding GntR family transcriptional regulator